MFFGILTPYVVNFFFVFSSFSLGESASVVVLVLKAWAMLLVAVVLVSAHLVQHHL